jgi:hypothetical protein
LPAASGGGDTRFTFDPAPDDYPVWSPDASRIAFSSDRGGNFDLYQHASNGAGEDELLFKSDHTKFVTDWSHDGRLLLYYDIDPKSKRDLWVLPMDGAAGERKPVPFLRTGFNESSGTFSPDGPGWRIIRMSPEETRFTCGRFRHPRAAAEDGWFRKAEAFFRSGAAMARSCSFKLPTTASWPPR